MSSENNKYDNWTTDATTAKAYLLENCELSENKKYGFYFLDGTGFVGTPLEFIPYLIRRFAAHPNDSFEIETLDYEVVSGELYEPEYEGQGWDPNKKDKRFL